MLLRRYGLPEVVVSDPQFTSAEFAAFLCERNIRHNLTSVYLPQSNGAVERFNRVLKEHLRTYLNDGVPGSRALQQVPGTSRLTLHSVAGVTPSKLFLGRQLNM